MTGSLRGHTIFFVLVLYFLTSKKSTLSNNYKDCIVLLCLYGIVFMTNQGVPQILLHHLRCGFV